MSDLILAWDVIKKIGAYLVKVPDDAPVVVREVVKHVYTSLTDIKELDLTENDCHFLNDLFVTSGLDLGYLLSGTCTKKDYELFKQAFNNFKDKPDWHIHAYFHDIKHQAKCDRDGAEHAHFHQMTKEAANGEITLLSQTHIPILRAESYARITREDVERYLKKHSLPLALLDVAPSKPTSTARDKARATVTLFIAEIKAIHPDFEPLNAPPDRRTFFNSLQAWAKAKRHYPLSGISSLKNHCPDLVAFQSGRPTLNSTNYYSCMAET